MNATPHPATPYDPPLGDADEIRRGLLSVAEHGRVVWLTRHGVRVPVIDFSPDLRDRRRYLWAFYGRRFVDESEAERVRQQVCRVAQELGSLPDAIDRFRSRRSKRQTVWEVAEQFLAEAPDLGSSRTGQPYAARTLDHYRRVLTRARPQLDATTMGQFFAPKSLLRFRAWFRSPEGRGLASDVESVNCFAALRAVVRHYQLDHPEFVVEWPATPTKQTLARRARKQRARLSAPAPRLTLPEVAQAIEAIPEARRPLWWVWFLTQRRKTEIRAVLGCDWQAPRILIGRSAEGKSSTAEIRDSTKTDVDGLYEMPGFVVELIERHCRHARLNPGAPLFRNPDPRATGPLYSDDALDATWRAALKACGVRWVPPYRCMKHAGVRALLDAGLSLEAVLGHTGLRTRDVLEGHYDDGAVERRREVSGKLIELAGRARDGEG